MLEIDHSLRVSDKVVPDMVNLTNLTLLSMAGEKMRGREAYYLLWDFCKETL